VAVICVLEFTVKDCAGVGPNLTDVAPVKLVPVMVIEVGVPCGALLGLTLVMVGSPPPPPAVVVVAA
jgi:hypothetical protein